MHMLQALLQNVAGKERRFHPLCTGRKRTKRQGAVFLVHSHGMLIYLLAARLQAEESVTYLIDSVLQEYAEKEKLFVLKE